MIKRIILIATNVFAFTMSTTQAQVKVDLEKLPYRTSIESILKDKEVFAEDRELITSLPSLTTEGITKFKFGNVHFSEMNQSTTGDLANSKIYFLFQDPSHGKLVGLLITIENAIEAKKLGEYIASKYGKSKILSPIPKPDSHGKLLGYPAELYQINDRTIIVADYYDIVDGKPSFSTNLFVILDDAKVVDKGDTRNVVDRVVKTYKTIN